MNNSLAGGISRSLSSAILHEIPQLSSEATVADAIALMAQADPAPAQPTPPGRQHQNTLSPGDCIVVQGLEGGQFGVLTAHDLIRLSVQHPATNQVTLGAVTPPARCLAESALAELATVIAQFQQWQIRHVVVVSDRGQYVGILTYDGVLSAQVANAPMPLVATSHPFEDRLEFLLGTSPAVTYSCLPDAPYRATFISANVDRLVGYSPEELTGHAGFWFSHIHPDDADGVSAALVKLFEQGHHKTEYRVQHRHGHYVWVKDEMQLVRDTSGHPIEVVGYLADVSDRKQAEQALQTSEAFRRAITDTAPIAMFVYDLNLGRLLFCNPAYEGYLDYSLEALQGLGDRFLDTILHPDTRDRFEAHDRCIRADTAGHTYVVEYALRCRDGSMRLIECHETVLSRNADSTPAQVLGMALDITDRARSEATLRASEAFRRAITDTAPIAIFVYDVDAQRHVFCNPAYETIVGYTLEELQSLGADALDTIYHPDTRDRVNAHDLRLLADTDDHIYTVEYAYRRKDGTSGYVNCRETVLTRNPDGTPAQILGMAVDVTERQQAEQQLLDSEAKLQEILNQSAAVIFVKDLGGRHTAVNQSFLDLFGCTRDAILGKTNQEFFPPAIAAQIDANDQHLLATGTPQQFEETLTLGHQHYVFLSQKFLLKDSKGTVIGLCGFSTDISDRKAMEAALQSSRDRLRSTLAALPDIVFRVSREGQYLDFFASDTMAEITQLDTFVGRDIGDNLPPEIAQADLQDLHRALQTGTVQTREQQVWVNGGLQYEEVRVAPCGNDEAVFVIRDVTERVQATLALQESQQLLQTVLDSFPLIVFWKDRNGVYLGANTHAAIAAGFTSPADMVGKTEIDMAWGATPFAASYQADDRAVIASGISKLGIEEPLTRADGSQIWLETNKAPLRNAAGEIIGVLGTAQDITARKHTEVALRNLSERLNLALQAGAIGTWDWDLVNDAVWDDRIRAIYGLQHLHRSITYQDWQRRIHPDDLDRVEALLQAAIDGTADFNTEFRIWRTDGELRWVQAIAQVRYNDEGRPIRMVGINQDISDRKRAEADLRYSRDLREIIFNESTDALFLVDADTLLTLDCNQRAVELFEASDKALLIGIAGHTLQRVQFSEAELAVISAEVKTQGVWSREVEYVTYRGNSFWGNLAAKLITVAGQRMHLVRVTDISDRQRAKAQLQERNQQLALSNEQLARATRLKDEFLANMSHELRTPLNAILGMMEGLQEQVFGPINAQQLNAVTIVERSANHLLSLINDILDVAKIESGQMEIHREATSLVPLCESSLVFIRQQAHKKHLEVQTQLPPDPPLLHVDDRRIRQVLINLLTNALKFTPTGGTIMLAAIVLPPRPDSLLADAPLVPWMRIAVVDTGIGIAPDQRDRLFQPFVQVDSALNRQFEGTGLGLALVKRIVELHGGTVSLSSEVGKGSRFTLELPCVAAAQPETAIANSGAIASAPTDAPVSTTRPLILLAEDNQHNVDTLATYLVAKGYRLQVAMDGEAALAYVCTERPDLILMDVQMPKVDGLEAIRQIRQNPDLAGIPIIALTAMAMMGDRERCLEAGADEYLSKPVKLKRLLETIQKYLRPATA